MLADEPTGNLDNRTSEEILELLRRLGAAGATIAVITHDRDIAAAAQRVVELRDGMIAAEGPTIAASSKPT
jgi:ABC-type lipoprotein export system ATPase subunit